MEGVMVYNGKGDQRDWYKVFFCLEDGYFYSTIPKIWPCKDPMNEDAKKHFKVGGPKLLIKW